LIAMAICGAALVWAIWQSKREGQPIGDPTKAPVAAD